MAEAREPEVPRRRDHDPEPAQRGYDLVEPELPIRPAAPPAPPPLPTGDETAIAPGGNDGAGESG
jgi:hypothetical protein